MEVARIVPIFPEGVYLNSLKRKLTKKEKEILNNYEALRGIKENTILSGGIAKKRKANLDDYDNIGYVDNSNDVDFGLDNYDNYNKED